MDQRLNTFLSLCETMNYHRTAEKLHLTQPAVTRQIQSLEQSLGVRLFSYDGRRLLRTKACDILEDYAVSQRCQFQELRDALQETERLNLRVGATKTIGDYVMAPLVERYLSHPGNRLSLTVDNTDRLLEQLRENQLDFALVEGFFDRSRYDWQPFQRERFVGICPKDHPFSGHVVRPEELFDQTLLVREPGSGTRRIFERELADRGYTLPAFSKVISISSFSLIKYLILRGMGVTFAYEAVAEHDDRFGFFTLGDEVSVYEFNFVYLKHTKAARYVEKFCGR